MRFINRLFLTSLFVFLVFSTGAIAQNEIGDKKISATSATDEAAIKSVVTQFFNLYSKKDGSAVSMLWSEKSPYFSGHKQDLERIFAEADRIELKNLTFGKISVEGANVKVRAAVEFSATESKTGKPYEVYGSKNRVVIFTKMENNWKIVRHIPAERDLALRLIEAKTEDERSQLLNAEKDLVNVYLARSLRDEADRLDGSKTGFSELINIYRLALSVAEQIGDKTEVTSALNSIGNAQNIQGRKNEALESYQKGVKLSEEAGDKDMLARLLGNIANVYFDLDALDKSLDYSQRSSNAAEETGNKRVIAGNLGRIGNIYTRRGNYLEAVKFQQQALTLREQINDVSGVAFSLNNLGIVEALQGNYLQASDYFERSLKLTRNRGARQLYNLGDTYKARGDFARAMNAYQKAVSLCEEFSSDECLAAVFINVGDLYNIQGDYEQAAKYLNKALASFEKLGSKNGQASALGGIAQVYMNLGQYEKAAEARKKALALFEEIGAKFDVIHSLNEIGKIYYALGDLTQAEEYFQKSLKLNESLGNNEEMASTFLSVADIELSKSDYVNALKNTEQAKFYYGKIIGVADNWKLYTDFGRAYRGLGKTTQARQSFEKAIGVVEDARNRIAGAEEETERFFENKVSAYNLLIDLLISQNNFPEAFAIAERTKARALLDVLENGKLDINKAMTVQEQGRERTLKNELVSLNAQISKENDRKQPDKTLLADLQKQLEKKRLEFEDFQTQLYAAHPELKIQRGETKPITLEESAKLLPDDKSALLEYVVTDNKAFLFVLTKTAKQSGISLKAYPIDIKQKDLAQKTANFRTKLAKGDLDFPPAAQDLYNLLLKPAEAQIKNKTNLIIVPDAMLWDLPFQALQPAQNRYLIETSAISYAPSLTALREMAGKNQNKQFFDATLLAFGNPAIGRETSERLKQVFMGERLDPLPEAERLVDSLKQMYGADRSKIYIGADAREEIAKTESSKYRILQFSAHGILNDVNPMYSHIVLAQPKETDKEDGLFEAWEMKDLTLNADMIVLSACETARGKFGSGEGVIGMSWSLFIAGAPTTVASQWKVESSSTTELMLEFHRQLLNGKNITKAEALRNASLKLLKMPQYKHPSYWAGFVMVGDGF